MKQSTSMTLHQREVEEKRLLAELHISGVIGERAKSSLLQMHYPWIQKRCAQILRHESDAQDAAQEVAMQVYNHLPRFEKRSSLRTWIGVIALRECICLKRKEARFVIRNHVADLITLHEDISRARVADPNEEADQRVAETLQLLAPNSRDVLHQRFYHELPLGDISQRSNISLSAAKMRLYRALDQFANAYQTA